jgi:phosphoglycolate phosphatase
VRETLLALRERGVKLAVVTNKESRYTRTVLDAHQLAPLFDRVVSGDTLPSKKPDPAGIASCLKQFGVPRQRAVCRRLVHRCGHRAQRRGHGVGTGLRLQHGAAD